MPPSSPAKSTTPSSLCNIDVSRAPCLLRVKQAILGVGGTVLGVVLNNVDLKHDQNYYYYTNYYGYYAAAPGRHRRVDRSRSRATATASNGASNVADEY